MITLYPDLATETPLWKLALGKHTLSVKATDKAGLSTTKDVAFRTATSFADVKAPITAPGVLPRAALHPLWRPARCHDQ